MLTLACDTSTSVLSIAVKKDADIVKIFHSDQEGASDYLFVVIDKFLKSLKLNLKDFDLFAAGLGPGSFTGLRVGLSAFKTFSFYLNKPIIGINSFEAIAYNIKERDKLICVIEDAKKNKVYAAVYAFDKKGNLKIRVKTSLFEIKDLMAKFNESVIFTGAAIRKYGKDILAKSRQFFLTKEKLWYPNAQTIAVLAEKKFRQGKTDNIYKITPLYLHSEKANITKPKKLI